MAKAQASSFICGSSLWPRLYSQCGCVDAVLLYFQVLKQMGGAGALQGLLKQMEGMK